LQHHDDHVFAYYAGWQNHAIMTCACLADMLPVAHHNSSCSQSSRKQKAAAAKAAATAAAGDSMQQSVRSMMHETQGPIVDRSETKAALLLLHY
jgi:hypothetical protein